MSLWGNIDSVGATGSGSITATLNSASVTGFTNTTTDKIEVGDLLIINDTPYRVKVVDSTSAVTLTEVYAGSTNTSSTVAKRETPRNLNVVDSNAIFGVDKTEASAGVDNVVSVAIDTAGSGYTAGALVVNNTGSGGTGFAGTFTVNGSGGITGVTITNVGSGYTSLPSISGDGGGSDGVLAGALGLGSHTHAGWVKRTVGTGGRAGRVHYETLVAMSSITGDASDDIEFPE